MSNKSVCEIPRDDQKAALTFVRERLEAGEDLSPEEGQVILMLQTDKRAARDLDKAIGELRTKYGKQS